MIEDVVTKQHSIIRPGDEQLPFGDRNRTPCTPWPPSIVSKLAKASYEVEIPKLASYEVEIPKFDSLEAGRTITLELSYATML